jgi:hypothetical protein
MYNTYRSIILPSWQNGDFDNLKCLNDRVDTETLLNAQFPVEQIIQPISVEDGSNTLRITQNFVVGCPDQIAALAITAVRTANLIRCIPFEVLEDAAYCESLGFSAAQAIHGEDMDELSLEYFDIVIAL